MKTVPCAHLPENLNLSGVTRPAWVEYAAWVVSVVVIRRYLDRSADATTFVPLAAKYVNAHIPAPVRKPLLTDLLQAGVLESDNLYYFCSDARGGRGKARCYRLGAAYREAAIRPHRLTHPELVRKMAAAWAVERAEVIGPVHIDLRNWHDRVELTAEAPRGEHPLLDRMLDGERRFTVCAQGRVHTNVGNLPAQYRQDLRLDGQELDVVDISNSQPLLLAVLLRREAMGGERAARRSPVAVCDTCSGSCLNDYLDHCLGGTIYDRLAADTGYTRDELKTKFLAVIYGHPRDMETRVGKAVRTRYPAVFDAVVQMNFQLGHGGLPRLMQRLESDMMIMQVAARLLRELPEMPLLTVHDSILAPAEYIERVEAVITEEWTAGFGVAPRTKRSAVTTLSPLSAESPSSPSAQYPLPLLSCRVTVPCASASRSTD